MSPFTAIPSPQHLFIYLILHYLFHRDDYVPFILSHTTALVPEANLQCSFIEEHLQTDKYRQTTIYKALQTTLKHL